MTDRPISCTRSALDAAIAASAAGDRIIFMTMGGDVEIDVSGLSWKPSVTYMTDLVGPMTTNFLGKPGGGGEIISVRKYYLTLRGLTTMNNGAGNPSHPTRFSGFNHRPVTSLWPDFPATGQTWYETLGLPSNNPFPDIQALFSTNSHTGDIEFDQVDYGFGYGPTGAAVIVGYKYPDFDGPTEYYDSTNGINPGNPTGDKSWLISPVPQGNFTAKRSQPGWGDATYRNQYPGALNGVSGLLYNTMGAGPALIRIVHGGNVKVTRSYFHDAIGRGALNIGVLGGSKVIVQGNVFARNFCDNVQIGWVSVAPGSQELIEGNIFMDPTAAARDVGNPHGDAYQSFFLGGNKAMIAREFNNNFGYCSPPTREAYQFGFATPDGTAYSIGTKARNNLALGANKGFTTTPARDPYVRNNMFLNPAWLNAGAGNLAASLKCEADAQVKGSGGGLVLNNIAEGIVVSTGAAQSVHNLSLATKSGGDQATYLVGGATPTTLWEAYEWAKRKPEYAGYGPPYTDLLGHLEGYDSTKIGEPISAQAPLVAGAARLATVRSELVYVHGGNVGETLPLTLTAGLRARIVELDQAEVAKGSVTGPAFSGSLATVTVGKFVQFETDTPDQESAILGRKYTVGGTPFTWTVQTLTANRYPAMTTTVGTKATRAGGLSGAVNGNVLSMLLMFKPTDLTAASRAFITTTSNRLALSNYGGSWFLSLKNASNAEIASFTASGGANNLVVNQQEVIAISVDLTKADFGSGVKIWRNGVPFSSFTSTSFSPANGPIRFNDALTVLDSFVGEVQLLAVWDEWIDFGAQLSKISINNPDQIGEDGSGLSTTGNAAKLFVTGRADRWNTGNANLGSGGALTKVGDGTQGLDKPWPPNLGLVSTVLTPPPYYAGKPIELLLQSTGYNKPLTLTGAATGIAGVWVGGADYAAAKGALAPGAVLTFTPSAAGTLQLNVGNNGGYVAPTQIAVDVAIAGISVPFRLSVADADGVGGISLDTSLLIRAA